MSVKKKRLSNKSLILPEVVGRKIYAIRFHKVMLASDLAHLYGVSVGRLNEAVRRNRERFPKDFMFQLTASEMEALRLQFETSNLKSQIAISSLGWGGRRHLPYAFTEQGVAMLSSILRSRRAVQVNIVIMRAFVRLREILSTHKELTHQLNKLENRVEKHDGEIKAIFDAIRALMTPPEKPRRRIGFHSD